MKSSLSQLAFIALLTLLQIIAPLVHAHAGYDDFSDPGVHMPGLERYMPCESHEMVASIDHRHSHSGVVVSVGTGLEKTRTKNKPASCKSIILTSVCLVFISNPSLLQAVNTLALPYFPQPPLNTEPPVRAPPAIS